MSSRPTRSGHCSALRAPRERPVPREERRIAETLRLRGSPLEFRRRAAAVDLRRLPRVLPCPEQGLRRALSVSRSVDPTHRLEIVLHLLFTHVVHPLPVLFVEDFLVYDVPLLHARSGCSFRPAFESPCRWVGAGELARLHPAEGATVRSDRFVEIVYVHPQPLQYARWDIAEVVDVDHLVVCLVETDRLLLLRLRLDRRVGRAAGLTGIRTGMDCRTAHDSISVF